MTHAVYNRVRGLSSDENIAIIVPTLGVVVSEALFYAGKVQWSLAGHLITLVVCTLAPLQIEDSGGIFHTFALVPLFRLVNLGVPVFFELTLLFFPFVYGPLIPGLYIIARSKSPMGPTSGKRTFVALAVFAVPLSLLGAEIEYRILRPQSLVPVLDLHQLVLIGIVMIVFVGFVEELLFRGILQTTLQSQIGRWPGLLLTSAVFGLMHSFYAVPSEIAFAALLGVVWGIIYDWTDSIPLVAFIHGMLNVFLFAVIPLRGSLLAQASSFV